MINILKDENRKILKKFEERSESKLPPDDFRLGRRRRRRRRSGGPEREEDLEVRKGKRNVDERERFFVVVKRNLGTMCPCGMDIINTFISSIV